MLTQEQSRQLHRLARARRSHQRGSFAAQLATWLLRKAVLLGGISVVAGIVILATGPAGAGSSVGKCVGMCAVGGVLVAVGLIVPTPLTRLGQRAEQLLGPHGASPSDASIVPLRKGDAVGDCLIRSVTDRRIVVDVQPFSVSERANRKSFTTLKRKRGRLTVETPPDGSGAQVQATGEFCARGSPDPTVGLLRTVVLRKSEKGAYLLLILASGAEVRVPLLDATLSRVRMESLFRLWEGRRLRRHIARMLPASTKPLESAESDEPTAEEGPDPREVVAGV